MTNRVDTVFAAGVVGAYFLALNALAGFLFLQGIRLRDRMRELETAWRRQEPELKQLASLAALALEARSATLKARQAEREA